MNNETATLPYDWVRHIPTALKDLDVVPLLGCSKPFNWEAYASSIADTFRLQQVSIKSGIPEWMSKEQLKAAVNGTPLWMNLTVSPLEGDLYLLLSQEELNFLIAFALQHTGKPFPPLTQPYEEVIKDFVIHEMIHLISKGGFDAGLTPLLKESVQESKAEHLLSLPLEAKVNEKEFRPLLLLSPTFLQSWRERYPLAKEAKNSKMAQQTGFLAHLEIGKIILTRREWSEVRLGDVLLFDQCTLDPKDEDKFRLMVVANGRPCFRARLKEHQLKILEFPLHYEVVTPMAKESHDEDEDDFEDDDFDEDESFEFDEDEDEEESEDEDEDFDEETDVEQTSHEEDTDFEDEFTEEEDEHSEFVDSEESSDRHTALSKTATVADVEEEEKFEDEEAESDKAAKSSGPATKVAADADSGKPQTFESLPLTLSVEIGRLHLSTQQLSALQPGNLLELDVRPEDGISLVFNDKVLAKGELLRIGEVLGVRILEIGK